MIASSKMKCMYIACLLLNSLLVLTAQMWDWILVLVLFKCKKSILFKLLFFYFPVMDDIRVSLKSLYLFLTIDLFFWIREPYTLFLYLLSVFPWIVSLIFNPLSFPALTSRPLPFVSNSKADITSCLPVSRKCKQSHSRAEILMEGKSFAG